MVFTASSLLLVGGGFLISDRMTQGSVSISCRMLVPIYLPTYLPTYLFIYFLVCLFSSCLFFICLVVYRSAICLLVSWYLPANHVLLCKLSNVQQEKSLCYSKFRYKKTGRGRFFSFCVVIKFLLKSFDCSSETRLMTCSFILMNKAFSRHAV